MNPSPAGDDGTLFDVARTVAKEKKPRPRRPAPTSPVARVAVNTHLPHLDRLFDYWVPEELDDAAVPGCRVRVRFNGQAQTGFLIERGTDSEHPKGLAYLQGVVSSEVVLSPEVLELSRAVAERYAGTLTDVLRLAVPPRHARVEKEEVSTTAPAPAPEPADPSQWDVYDGGPELLAALERGESPRTVWDAAPGVGWPDAVAEAVAATLRSNRGALVVVPDGRDVATVDSALAERLGAGHHTSLVADLGPAERYRRWLATARGHARVVVGTRAAMFAPVHDLGLVVLWDDGDDTHSEPHAPYPHARTVLGLRAHQSGAAALIGGFSRTTDAQMLVRSGWATEARPIRSLLRRLAPRVRPAGDDAELERDPAARSARLPSLALRVAREALRTGPVLIQVPRRGYLNTMACDGCRTPARCGECHGPLALTDARAQPSCRWCGRLAVDWRCPHCGRGRLRAVSVGAQRTAEELGRAFPNYRVRTSGGGAILTDVDTRPELVVATPGAEPSPPEGYQAALLLDGWSLLGREDLRAGEETLRRWLSASALVRSAPDGGQVVVVADASLDTTQALVRWDPAGFADRELDERLELGFPPAVPFAAVSGAPDAVRAFLDSLDLPPSVDILGPVPTTRGGEEQERALIRAPRGSVWRLARTLRSAMVARAARRPTSQVNVRVDPSDIG
ncbi:primosomal protein N' [Spiractinospora alimapuensis]|uniref:primosomal protein N' n=1 Tax=Spiractinospora alimapuensis TaxID=2820884 RepID=UPI001F187A2D|nr:primosomal protein N' [Spiractinospora alimapuensis]QVQ53190.1 primosomal protein N' [Spiractinospora alimapuensis]